MTERTQPMNRRIKIGVGVAGIALLGGLGAVGCTEEPTKSSGQVQEEHHRSQENDPHAQTPDDVEPPAKERKKAEADESKDVTLVSCGLIDVYGLEDPTALADLTIKNNSTKTSDYTVEVEFLNTSGTRVDHGYTMVQDVAPGQTLDDVGASEGYPVGEEDAGGTATGLESPLSCNIIDVERTATAG